MFEKKTLYMVAPWGRPPRVFVISKENAKEQHETIVAAKHNKLILRYTDGGGINDNSGASAMAHDLILKPHKERRTQAQTIIIMTDNQAAIPCAGKPWRKCLGITLQNRLMFLHRYISFKCFSKTPVIITI